MSGIQEPIHLRVNEWRSSPGAALIVAWFVVGFVAQYLHPALQGKWLMYSTPLVAVTATLFVRGKWPQVPGVVLIGISAILAATSVALLVNQAKPISYQAVRDVLIILGVVLCASLNIRLSDRLIYWMFVGYVAQYIAELAVRGLSNGIEASLIGSSSAFESSSAFSFAAFFVYFASAKRKYLTVVSGVLSLLAFKRSAMIAVVVVAVAAYLTRSMNGPRRLVVLRIISAVFAALLLLVATRSDELFHVLISGVRVISEEARFLDEENFMMGRMSYSMLLSSIAESRNFIEAVFGSGPGTADRIIERVFVGTTNAHNDMLKLVVDYGFVGAALILFGLGCIYCRSQIGCMLFVLLLVCLPTDNLLIYIFFHFPALLLAGEYAQRESPNPL